MRYKYWSQQYQWGRKKIIPIQRTSRMQSPHKINTHYNSKYNVCTVYNREGRTGTWEGRICKCSTLCLACYKSSVTLHCLLLQGGKCRAQVHVLRGSVGVSAHTLSWHINDLDGRERESMTERDQVKWVLK